MGPVAHFYWSWGGFEVRGVTAEFREPGESLWPCEFLIPEWLHAKTQSDSSRSPWEIGHETLLESNFLKTLGKQPNHIRLCRSSRNIFTSYSESFSTSISTFVSLEFKPASKILDKSWDARLIKSFCSHWWLTLICVCLCVCVCVRACVCACVCVCVCGCLPVFLLLLLLLLFC